MIKYKSRVMEDAANKPNASTAYDLAGTAVTGYRTFASQYADGENAILLAEQIDVAGKPAGAWEHSLLTFNNLATDTLSRVLIDSSTASLIDWSTATGIDETPRLSVIDLPGYGMRIFDQQTASGATTVDFTGLQADKNYWCVFNELDVSNDAVGVFLRTSTDGSTYDTTSYEWSTMYGATGAPAGIGSASANAIYPFSTNLWGNADDEEEGCGQFTLYNPGNANTHTRVTGDLKTATSASAPFNIRWGGSRQVSEAVTAFQFGVTAGTLSGKFTLYELSV